MELFLPDRIALNGTSLQLIEGVEETARLVNEHRPLPAAVTARIQNELLGERVFSSNAIEGNTLDLRETVIILKTGHLDSGRRKEATEARNLGEAIGAVSRAVSGDAGCHTPERFLEMHGTVMRDLDDTWGGRFRERRVMVTGATHQPPDHRVVPGLVAHMMDLLRRLDGDPACAVKVAAWAHWAIARIHPFVDGNGRVARLWQDLVLFRANLTCAIIRPEDRCNYLDALGSADEGDFDPLVQLIAQRVAATLDRYVAKIAESEELDDWAKEIAGEVDDRMAERRELSYQRWTRRMEQLRAEFELCAGKINASTDNVAIQVRRFDALDRARWENIRAGIGAQRTWFFTIDFRRGAAHLRYYFLFGRHFWSDLDNDLERAEQRVCLLISESDEESDAVRVDQMDVSPISLLEVFVVEDRFVRRRRDVATGADVYDRDVTAMQIAKDFLRDVMLLRLR